MHRKYKKIPKTILKKNEFNISFTQKSRNKISKRDNSCLSCFSYRESLPLKNSTFGHFVCFFYRDFFLSNISFYYARTRYAPSNEGAGRRTRKEKKNEMVEQTRAAYWSMAGKSRSLSTSCRKLWGGCGGG